MDVVTRQAVCVPVNNAMPHLGHFIKRRSTLNQPGGECMMQRVKAFFVSDLLCLR